MNVCFPIEAFTPTGDDAGGTGFFGATGEKVWLITAAHVPLGFNPPHDEWEKWPETVDVLLGDDEVATRFPLFRNTTC